MQDVGTKTEDGKIRKNNMSVIDGTGIGAYINSGGGKGVNCDWYNSYILENSWRSTSTPYSEPRQADVVVIYLGTNDNAGLGGINTEAKINELANGMKLLIERVKSYNPNAKIVWVSGGMTDKYRESANRAINSFGGSEKGYFLCDVPNNMKAGQNGHPDAAQQRIIAKALEDFLKANVIK
jgi:lysophospholipase L1-like esterase